MHQIDVVAAEPALDDQRRTAVVRRGLGVEQGDLGVPRADLDNRTRLLHAATDAFAEFGYEGASLRAIADNAGVASWMDGPVRWLAAARKDSGAGECEYSSRK